MSVHNNDPRFFVPPIDGGDPSSEERDISPVQIFREAGVVGPPLAVSDPDHPVDPAYSGTLAERQAMMTALYLDAARLKRERRVRGQVGFNTDGSGNALAAVYQVRVGFRLRMTRCIVEVAGFAVASAATAGAFVAALETLGGTSDPSTIPLGQLRAWAGTSGAGLFLPVNLVEDEDSGPTFVSGSTVELQVGGSQAALANKGGSVYFEGKLSETD